MYLKFQTSSAFCMQMTHFAFHSVRTTLKTGQARIKSSYYLQKKGMKTTEIHDVLVKILGEDTPFYSIKKWVADFKKAGRALIMMHGQGARNQLPPMPRWKGFIVW